MALASDHKQSFAKQREAIRFTADARKCQEEKNTERLTKCQQKVETEEKKLEEIHKAQKMLALHEDTTDGALAQAAANFRGAKKNGDKSKRSWMQLIAHLKRVRRIKKINDRKAQRIAT